MNRLLLLILCVIGALDIHSLKAQNDPYTQKIFLPSPNAYEIVKYGNYPVSMSTGLPQINIPLLTAKSGALALDISLSYHSSGTKLSDSPSIVGLGWSLNAGGAVTRAINGRADEIDNFKWTESTFGSGVSSTMPGFYDFPGIPDNCYECDMAAETRLDWQPDLFNFSAGNISGAFIFDYNKKPILINGTEPFDISVNFTTNEIVIVDKSGTKYYFGGGLDYLEYSDIISYGGPSASKKHVSAWQLRRIETFNSNDFIDFSYVSSASSKIDYSRSISVLTYKNHVFVGPDGSTNGTVEYPYTETQNQSHNISNYSTKNLSKISFDGGNIQFFYSSRLDDSYYYDLGQRLSDIKLFRGTGSTELINHVELFSQYTSSASYSVSPCSSTIKYYQKRLLLGKIRIHGSAYNNQYGDIYSFTYNSTPIPDYNSYAYDHWGYYNGNLENDCYPDGYLQRDNYFTAAPSLYFGDGDMAPDAQFTKAGVLEKITFPTGGFTEFEYEGNTSISGNRVLGGLRISKITSKTSSSDSQPIVKKYEYNEGSYNGLLPDPYLNISKAYRKWTSISFYDDQVIETLNPNYKGAYVLGPPAIYTKVTEYQLTTSGKSIGRTEHFFRFMRDEGSTFVSVAIPFLSMSSLLSKPDLVKTYDSIGALVSQVDYIYNKVDGIAVSGIAAEKTHFLSNDGQNYTCVGYAFNRYPWTTYNEFLQRTEETVYDIAARSSKVVTSYTYANPLHNQPTKIEKAYTNSQKTYTTRLKYPRDYSGLNGGGPELLASKGIKDQVIEKQEYLNNKLISGELWEYEISSPYPKSVYTLELQTPSLYTETSYTGLFPPGLVNDYKKRYEFIYSPVTGLLQSQYQTGGIVTSYLYSYGGKLPIAELVGVKLNNGNWEDASGNRYLASTFNSDFSVFNDLNLNPGNKSKFGRIRSSLPSAFITTYTYDPLRGTTSVTDKNGMTQYYDYDEMGRLRFVKDYMKNVLKSYEYNLIIKN